MYNYQTERPKLFTEEGQIMFMKIRDKAHKLLKEAGAFSAGHVTGAGGSGDSWTMIACIDRLVELGEIIELTDDSWWGQYKVYASPKKHNR